MAKAKGMNLDDRPVRVFMDGIDWQHHLDADADGTKLYPSVAALRRGKKCVNSGECGIVEVEVRVIRWREPQNLSLAVKKK